ISRHHPANTLTRLRRWSSPQRRGDCPLSPPPPPPAPSRTVSLAGAGHHSRAPPAGSIAAPAWRWRSPSRYLAPRSLSERSTAGPSPRCSSPFSRHIRTSGTNHFFFLLGGDGPLGRDEFLRLPYGAQVSLEVALDATLLSMLLGVALGATAGYLGGWVDA